MKSCLAASKINDSQVYSISTDNGNNVTKLSELIDLHFEPDEGQDDDDDLFLEDLDNALNGVRGVRCTMHTFQLAVVAAVDTAIEKELLKKIRAVVKKCQTVAVRQILIERQVELPLLDVITRWGSTYDMLQSCSRIRSALDQIWLLIMPWHCQTKNGQV
ncbi:hypothetical protein LEN26_014874 [Aphanomyces euteiches]|nr:hypothetical protein LEN26_014874 [Aphanomyces euteiches]